jgi:hypothetical protein
MQRPVQWILRTEAARPNPADQILYNRSTTFPTTKTARQAVAGFPRHLREKMEIEGYIDQGRTHYYAKPIPLG